MLYVCLWLSVSHDIEYAIIILSLMSYHEHYYRNGISKTGVFLTLFYAVLAVNSGQSIVSIGHTVGLLRQRRRAMVSTQQEYLFCHTALLYYAQDILVKRKRA